MNHLVLSRLLLFTALAVLASFAPSRAGVALAQAGDTVAGRVVDADNRPVVNAAVAILDAETGLPLEGWSQNAFDLGSDPSTLDPWTAMTGRDGRFSFQRVPAGRYRLVAQSWPQPSRKPLALNGPEVHLRGIAENVRVPSTQAADVEIKPLGQGVLHIELSPPAGNSSAVLILSLTPPRGDAIMGFLGWGADFAQDVIGINRMPYGRTLVLGLPDDQPVHMAVIVPDNSPGFGVSTAQPSLLSPAQRSFAHAWWDHARVPTVGASTVQSAYRDQFGRIRLPAFSDAIFGLEKSQLAELQAMGDAGALGALIDALGPLDRKITLPNRRGATVQDLLLALRDPTGRTGPPLPPHVVPIVARWSDAHHFPPSHIQRVMAAFKGRVPSESEVTGIPANQLREIYRKTGAAQRLAYLKALPPLDKQIQLPDGSRARVIDVMAARAYGLMHADFAANQPQWWQQQLEAHRRSQQPETGSAADAGDNAASAGEPSASP